MTGLEVIAIGAAIAGTIAAVAYVVKVFSGS